MTEQRVIRYNGINEQYTYYLRPFIHNDKKYPSGYYTTDGHFYKNVIFTNQKSICTCKNCKHRFYTYHMSTKIMCPNCNQEITIQKVDTIQKMNKSNEDKEDKTIIYLFSAISITLISIFLLAAIILYDYLNKHTNLFNTQSPYSVEESIVEPLKTVYVEELGRTCDRLAYNLYYDKQTDCYFKFDTEVSPSQWYYYFNGISNKYSSSIYDGFGWMSYNGYNKVWNIKIGHKQWQTLDKQDVTDRLWHFKAMTKNLIE